jgi:hypothetical protein
VTYRQRFGRGHVLGLFAVFAVATVVLTVWTVAGGPDRPPLLFTGLWLGALAWNAYWWLLRVAVVLRLEPGTLTWEVPLRGGQLPVPAITRVRPMRFGSSAVVIEHVGGRPVLVVGGKGLRHLFDDLSRMRPDLDLRMGWQARLSERLPGASRWQGRD